MGGRTGSSLAKQLILLAALALFVGWMIARPPSIEVRIGGGGFTGGIGDE